MATNNYATMSSEDFDRILRELINEQYADLGPPCNILSIPGIYEILSEHFNNDVLERWDEQQPEISCAQCGEPFFTSDAGTTHHGEPDAIDFDADADHVAYGQAEP